MDEQTAEALEYRIKQLEHKIQRAMNYVSELEVYLRAVQGTLKNTKWDETELHLIAIQGTLKNTKWDFENLRRFCK